MERGAGLRLGAGVLVGVVGVGGSSHVGPLGRYIS